MKLSEMRDVLKQRGIQLTKSLGQNFLHDGNQLRRIIEAAQLTKQDKVLEIGPGLGALTELLVERAGEVLAIEKDQRLVDFLWERFPTISEERVPRASNSGLTARSQGLAELAPPRERTDGTSNLRLLHADALEHLKRERHDWSDWKLVANLPYSVASPILVELAQGRRSPQRIVVTLQLEVAKRLMANAGDDDYGLLTLLVQLDSEPRDWFKIPAGCFFPEPDVDSACVCLVRRPQPLLTPEQRGTFTKIVKRAFSQRRKMTLKLLKADWPTEKLERAFEELRILPQERAERLSLGQFVRLAEILCVPAPPR
jgi:16S rRNA (adenine1518-N6/adenine1519-N6)-dimethyltransferase